MIITRSQWLISITLLLLILLTLQLYSPGLTGAFILDDIPNLSSIGNYINQGYWYNFWLFLLEGDSGPTGRPLSLASFFLNDYLWPSAPEPFIYTNILIHLLNGVLIFWFTNKLATTLFPEEASKNLFPIIATALWLLHPFHATTVLYVIQRMTELSATFTLTGLLFFLYGREKLQTHTLRGLALLTFGIGLSLILTIISKENGALLIAYIFVIELFLLQPFKNRAPQYYYYWLIPIIVLPFIFLLAYLAQHLWLTGGYQTRDFSLEERLLTESRVLFDYLYHILLPNNKGTGLFHDDYIISTGLFTPWTTFPAVIGIVSLLISTWILRKKTPFIAFSIAWFFAGHLLESTTIALELYFEHRNYLPMLGFLIVAGFYLSQFINKHPVRIGVLTFTILALFSFLTLQNAQLWGKPTNLILNAYIDHPHSIRAQEAYKAHVGAIQTVKTLEQQELHASYTAFSRLNEACQSDNATQEKLQSTLNILGNHPIETATANALFEFTSNWLKGSCPNISSNEIELFLLSLVDLDNTNKSPLFLYHCYYSLSDIYRNKRHLNNTIVYLKKAFNIIPNTKLLILQSKYLSSAGLYKEALDVLNDTSRLKTTFKKRLILKLKQQELDFAEERIRRKIAELEKKGTLSFN